MRLKSLQMQGFKSFPNKIEITFDTGMTAVVGPNGSGKSNISDAIRWVLGEQSSKNLRGNKMEDVIFSGTKSRNPSAFASVTLTIDNTDRGLNIEQDTVSINRCIYRSGDSECKINGKSVRLKDINELFMDTGLGKDGYSIISQGKIAEIVSSKSLERREIFEQACGISKFRYKKVEAEKKLSLAEDNMLRLYDILSELESRLKPLEEQSKKAKKFVELSENKKGLEVSIWLFKINDLKSILDGINERINIAQSQYNDLESTIETSESRMQDGYIKMQESSAKVDELQRSLMASQQKFSESSSNVVVYQNDIQHANEKILELKKSKEDNLINKDSLNSKVEELTSNIDSMHNSLKDVVSQIDTLNNALLSTDENFNSLNDELLEISSQINLIKHDIQNENLTLISVKTVIEETQSQLDSMETNNKEVEILCDNYKKEIIEVTSNLEVCRIKEVELNNQLEGFKKLLSNKDGRLNTIRESYENISLEIKEKQHRVKLLVELENSMEGFSKSVKLIMKASKKGELKGVFGSVAQLLETNQEYTIAIEVALGGTLQNIVVENEDVAKSCIRYLKSKDGGRATFLPLTSIKSQDFNVTNIKDEFGYVGIASDLVTCEPKFDSIKHNLLGKIIIMDNLECASVVSKKYGYRFKIVTLDGQVINAGGSFTGGSAVHSEGVFSRKSEIDALNQSLDNLSTEEKTLQDSIASIKSEIDNIHLNIERLNSSIMENKSMDIKLNADLKRLNDTISQYENTLNSADMLKSTLLRKLENSTDKKLQSEKNIKEFETNLNVLEDTYNSKMLEKNLLSQKRDVLLNEVSKLKVLQVENSKDLETFKNILNDTKDKLSNLNEENSNLDLEIFRQEGIIQQKQQYILDSQTLSSELSNRIETLKSEIQSWQNVHNRQQEQITQIRVSLKNLNNDKESLSRELIRLDEKRKNSLNDYDNIISQLFDIYEMTFSEAEKFATPVEDVQSAQRELAEIKLSIKSLGNVNVSAIDEFEEVSKRYKFLNEQLSDTKKSKVELEKLIESLTKDMKNLFKENFYKINENFKQIFIELFGGGTAELVLTDKDDILNSGIEILVSPPGKIIKNLISLSGGEQAFVSIAIYFAILKLKPSPFCILDEIDAPLDEVNVRKYALYLNRFIDKTQFIVVTHRRGTMETANVLYGVTMQKDGVSKLLKMEQNDIPNENF
ncbi:MAG: chromosome segregation protein SMC [Oscillospiraceae bacterium]